MSNIIPVNDAVDLTTNWRTYFENLDPTNTDYIRAFKIPKDVITALAAMTEADDYRVYFGTDDDTSIDASYMKLMFVGIDSSGNDIIDDGNGNSLIYDFMNPCPPTCDGNSVLYTGE